MLSDSCALWGSYTLSEAMRFEQDHFLSVSKVPQEAADEEQHSLTIGSKVLLLIRGFKLGPSRIVLQASEKHLL